jgi:hypothetical protein
LHRSGWHFYLMEAPFLDELMTPADDISVIRGEFGGG